MTIDQAVKITYELREKNQDYPDSSSEDYLAILQLINSAINQWESQAYLGILWKELFTPNVSVTITSGQGDAPSDFLFPSSLYIGSTEYRFVRPEEAVKTTNQDPSAKIYWITGGGNARKINCSDDGTGTLSYYKKATTYTDGTETDEIEMSDPYFAVYFALGQLYLDDANPQAQFTNEVANEKLTMMKLNNESNPFYQADEPLTDTGLGI